VPENIWLFPNIGAKISHAKDEPKNHGYWSCNASVRGEGRLIIALRFKDGSLVNSGMALYGSGEERFLRSQP
jgi:hypothetical protein